MTMRIDIITLFPELCEAVMGESSKKHSSREYITKSDGMQRESDD